MREEYAVRRDLMLSALDGIPGVRPFAPRGAFYVWAELDQTLYTRLGVTGADELSAQLAANGIGSAPGDAFGEGCANAIRFAFSCDTEMIRTGAALLRSALLGEAAAVIIDFRRSLTFASGTITRCARSIRGTIDWQLLRDAARGQPSHRAQSDPRAPGRSSRASWRVKKNECSPWRR